MRCWPRSATPSHLQARPPSPHRGGSEVVPPTRSTVARPPQPKCQTVPSTLPASCHHRGSTRQQEAAQREWTAVRWAGPVRAGKRAPRAPHAPQGVLPAGSPSAHGRPGLLWASRAPSRLSGVRIRKSLLPLVLGCPSLARLETPTPEGVSPKRLLALHSLGSEGTGTTQGMA